ncbi:glutathione S-transferase family protein [Caulobacter sp. UNC358MFTsu5.1]|uniref:glutathione S-transferase family protein n=1 Tax=Caulobacter sp. UNC358MFTsu5.1 TaxID=1449049 RepID=UPI0004A6FCF8|nr:glutathione S-transferase N-terminal domain-containing protein [Caulobacter sp. UNC358MFTsu5.1]
MDQAKAHYTLHAAPGSCSFAAHVILEEIGEPYTIALMSPGHPETHEAWFRTLNPKGRVPVLMIGNLVITEAPAILVHLGLARPDAGLLDTTGENLVRSIEWFNWLSGHVHAVSVRMIWRPDYFCDDSTAAEPIILKGRQHLAADFARIESALTDRIWAVGESYSIVDPYLLVFYRWGNRMGLDMRRDYLAWTDHSLRLEQRPAVQRCLQKEGVSLWRR